MKTKLLVGILVFLGLMSVNMINSQSQYTPYDELPTIPRSDKPAYSNNYPDWAKMLYQYPINSSFEKYISQNKGVNNPIVRYFKLWRRSVSSFAKDDGTIVLPDLNNLNEAILRHQVNVGSELKASELSNSSWTFIGPKETYWLNSSGSTPAPGSCPWQVNVYALEVAPVL
jgi:hypothetical protein